MEEFEEELTEEESQQALQDRLDTFATKLVLKAEEQVAMKKNIEKRWLDDMRNYYGVYDRALDTNSALFVNITRPKATAAESRIADMLFPTDDRNFSIRPTPVPELEESQDNNTVVYQSSEGVPVTGGEVAAEILKKAKDASKKMQDEIDDQLNECDYSSKGRDVIHDAVVLGTGVIKGPVNVAKEYKRWGTLNEGGEEVSVLQIEQTIRPESFRVDPWSFFPDMSARDMEECEFIFERHLLTKKQMRDLADDHTFISTAIADCLKSEPSSTTADYIHDLKGITDDSSQEFNRYEVWEYHGPIDKEDMIAAGVEIDTDDTLTEVNAVVWICDNKVIKVIMNPLETGEFPYDVFNWEEDTTSVFGFGVPYLINNAQRVVNASWRMMMDNAALSVGPQIVVNEQLIEPAPVDGKISWKLEAKKVWRLKEKDRNVQEAFGAFHINTNQEQLAQIFQLARELGDAETNLPMIAQGEMNGPMSALNTASGMNLLMNSANISLKKAVKNFDDNITRRHIRRYYDWNMQNSDKQELKGDYTVDARGSSSLLLKETQAQNMANLVNIANLPAFAQITDFKELYKMAINAMQIEADDIVIDQTPEQGPSPEQQQMQMQQQQMQQDAQMKQQLQQAELQIKQAQIQAEQQIRQQQTELEYYKIQMEREIAMMKLAQDRDVKIEDIKAKFASDQTARDIAATKAKTDMLKEQGRHQNLKMGFDTY